MVHQKLKRLLNSFLVPSLTNLSSHHGQLQGLIEQVMGPELPTENGAQLTSHDSS